MFQITNTFKQTDTNFKAIKKEFEIPEARVTIICGNTEKHKTLIFGFYRNDNHLSVSTSGVTFEKPFSALQRGEKISQ